METTFKRTVKGAIMESIFDSCNLFSVKYYQNLTLKKDEDFNEEKLYKYELRIRHSEGTDAKVLFTQAVETINNIQ